MKGVPWRSWRWLWAWQIVRAASVLILCPFLVLYLLAKGIVEASDWYGAKLGKFYVRCYNRDLGRSER